MTSTTHFVSVPSATIAVEEFGAGPALVLIHAGVTDRRSWREVAALLADRYRVVTFDRRGFGETTHETASFSPLADLLAVLDALEIDTAVVGGCSNGGRIAMQAAIGAGERVGGLVLIDTAVDDGKPAAPHGDELVTLFAAIREAEAGNDIEAAIRLKAHLWLDGPLQSDGRVTGAARDLFLEMNRTAAAAVPAGDEIGVDPTLAQLAGLRHPTLVIVGEYDVAPLVTSASTMASTLADARLVVIPDSAHLPMLDAPEAFSVALAGFLAELDAPASEPDTVTEAAAFLAVRGYDAELELRPDGLGAPGESVVQPFASAIVDYQFRFEGPSDPADEAIVLGIRCPAWNGKGVVISAFGPGADPDETAILRSLARPPAR